MDRSEYPLPKIVMSHAGAGWLQKQLSHIKKTQHITLSPFGAVVADILGYLNGGIYNLGRVNWERWGLQFDSPDCIEIVVPSRGGWSTYDNSTLTQIVVVAALTGVRIEINPVNRNYFRLYFHRRYSRHLPDHPDISRHAFAYTHPTLAQLAELLTDKYFRVEWEAPMEVAHDPA